LRVLAKKNKKGDATVLSDGDEEVREMTVECAETGRMSGAMIRTLTSEHCFLRHNARSSMALAGSRQAQR
jgi:hypothetical protein